jgi:hypothetical protein
MKKLILLVFIGLALPVFPMTKNNFDVKTELYSTGYDIDEIMIILKMVESMGQANAVSPRGNYLGILQIGKMCVKEINRLYGTEFIHADALDVFKAEEMFRLVMQKGIKYYTRIYKKPPTEEVLVRMWNGGIYNGFRSKSTIPYYQKYLRFKLKYADKLDG